MKLKIEELTNLNWANFENLFLTCEQCKECWCLNHRVPPSKEVTGEKAKLEMKRLVNLGHVSGLLGFVGESCVAWLSIDPLASQLGHDFVLEGNQIDKDHWAIHCIYIKPEFRRNGLSKQMINSAIEYAKSKGAIRISAFPIPEGEHEHFPVDDAEFSGRYSTYRKLGFKDKHKINNFYQVVDLNLMGSE